MGLRALNSSSSSRERSSTDSGSTTCTRTTWLPRSPPCRLGRPLAAQAEAAAVLGAGGQGHGRGAVDRGHLDPGAQHRLGQRYRHLALDVAAAALEDGVRRDPDDHVQVPRRRAARGGAPLAGDAYLRTRVDARRDLDLALLDAAVAVPQAHPSRGAAQRVLEGNLQGLLDVLPALRRRRGALAAPEQVLEQAAEALGEAPSGAEDVADVAALEAAEAAARVEGLVPEAVVFRPVLGAAQHLVGLGDVLELLLRGGVPGVDVRVVLARQPPVRLLDLLVGGAALDVERLVVVLLGHGTGSLGSGRGAPARRPAARNERGEIMICES